MLSGQITFWIDEIERYDLATGDSLTFRSIRLHRWWNDGDAVATLLWINVPVVEATSDFSAGRSLAHPRPNDGAPDAIDEQPEGEDVD